MHLHGEHVLQHLAHRHQRVDLDALGRRADGTPPRKAGRACTATGRTACEDGDHDQLRRPPGLAPGRARSGASPEAGRPAGTGSSCAGPRWSRAARHRRPRSRPGSPSRPARRRGRCPMSRRRARWSASRFLLPGILFRDVEPVHRVRQVRRGPPAPASCSLARSARRRPSRAARGAPPSSRPAGSPRSWPGGPPAR